MLLLDCRLESLRGGVDEYMAVDDLGDRPVRIGQEGAGAPEELANFLKYITSRIRYNTSNRMAHIIIKFRHNFAYPATFLAG